MRTLIVIVSILLLFVVGALTQEEEMEPIGIFENHMDINNPLPSGDASYDPQEDEYEIIGGGVSTSDDMHFLYSEVTGDFRIAAKIRSEDEGGSDPTYATAGIMARDCLQRWASDTLKRTMCWAWMTIADRAIIRWDYADGSFEVAPGTPPGLSPNVHDGRLEVIREGDTVTVYYYDRESGQQTLYDQKVLDIPETLYVGLFATSFRANGTTIGYFTDVQASWVQSSVEDWALYK